MSFVYLRCHFLGLINRGGDAFCLAIQSVLKLHGFIVCSDHVITLSHCNLTAKHDGANP